MMTLRATGFMLGPQGVWGRGMSRAPLRRPRGASRHLSERALPVPDHLPVVAVILGGSLADVVPSADLVKPLVTERVAPQRVREEADDRRAEGRLVPVREEQAGSPLVDEGRQTAGRGGHDGKSGGPCLQHGQGNAGGGTRQGED